MIRKLKMVVNFGIGLKEMDRLFEMVHQSVLMVEMIRLIELVMVGISDWILKI